MFAQHPTSSQHTSTSQLDAHLNGVREEFERLNQELCEARKQLDEYEIKYSDQANELRELRRRSGNDHVICQHCNGEISHICAGAGVDFSPVSSYYSTWDRTDAAYDGLDNSKAIDLLEEESNQGGDAGQVREGDIFSRGEDPAISGIASLSFESDVTCTKPGDLAWEMKSTTTSLKLSLVHELTQESGACVAFSKDGKYFATASRIGKICIFDTKTGERISVMRVRDLYAKPEEGISYRSLDFSPDSKYLATGGEDGKIRIWIISQKRVKSIFSHGAAIYDLHFSPDGHFIVASSQESFKIWRLRDGFLRVLTSVHSPSPNWSVRFSPDGRYVISTVASGLMLIWNVRRGKLVARMRIHFGGVTSLRFTSDGKGLLSASEDHTVTHWDVSSLSSFGRAQLDDSEGVVEDDLTKSSSEMQISRFAGHTAIVSTVSISRDGKWIVSGSLDKTVRIWNAHNDSLQCILDHRATIWSVDFSPLGDYLAIGDAEGRATIWNYAEM